MKHCYLVQRFHPNLRLGWLPSVARGTHMIPLHCRQGQWDGACGAHCVAMALALLGEITNAAEVSERQSGVAARLWKAAQATYFTGMNALQMAAMVESLQIRRHVACRTGRHATCLAFAQQHVADGHAVIVSWHSRHGRHHHWALLVGMEGMQKSGEFRPNTLLALDPGVDEPIFGAYNARLEYTVHPAPRCPTYIRYFTSDGATLAVRLTSVVALGPQR